ncbi:MAG: hypothetical protein MJK15_04510 [Colwellia sp.]|nr:hypothetical protein [Colwellia sp.]
MIETRLVITSIVILLPSLIWYLMRKVHSPWWLENAASTPFTILLIYLVLMLVFIYFLSLQQCVIYLLVNFILALFLNNLAALSHSVAFNNQPCSDSITIFQFNIKYQAADNELIPLIEHLIAEKYHLIALQGVSQQLKRQMIVALSPYFPHFISGGSAQQQVFSDQLLFSRYAFANINYYKNGQNSFLISSQWQLPFTTISLHSLHPPSPRNEALWQIRNKTLYQLKDELKNSTGKYSLVIGDLNLSTHSNRINNLKQGMNTEFVNSWPNKRYILSFFALAIDHLWVSKPASICARQRINKFTWSDHYAIKTQVDFNK